MSEDIYKLDREIIKAEDRLRSLRKEMFISLIGMIDPDKPFKTDSKLLGRLFNICRILSEDDDPRAKYWMAMFYGGKFGSSIVGPEYRKAIWYLNGINGRIPIYELGVEICDYFGNKENALSYALQGVVASDVSEDVRLRLARYFADHYIEGKPGVSIPEGTGKDFIDSFIAYIRKNCSEFCLSESDLKQMVVGFAA